MINSENLLEQAKSLVQKMSDDDRREFLAWMALDAKKVKLAVLEANSDRHMWFLALLRAFNDVQGIEVMPAHGRALQKPPTAFATCWASCDHFMYQFNLHQLKTVERKAIYSLLAHLVMRQAMSMSQSKGIPMSLNMACAYGANLPGIFNAAFPGYAKSGLVPGLARRMLDGDHDGRLPRP